MYDFNSVTLFGHVACCTARTFTGNGRMPFLSIKSLKNSTNGAISLHLCLFAHNPAEANHLKNLFKACKWSALHRNIVNVATLSHWEYPKVGSSLPYEKSHMQKRYQMEVCCFGKGLNLITANFLD